MKHRLAHLLSVARGNEPADLVLANARVVNVFSGKVESGDVAIAGEFIAGIGEYREALNRIDLRGAYLIPGFIDGHVHIESSMLDIGQYARAVVPVGTTTVVTDLHEIANVAGLEGIQYVFNSVKKLPLDVFLMAPSCVPATALETSGARIGVMEIKRILRMRQCIGLGEVMNYPGVIGGDETMLGKITAANGRVIDGHAPGLSGKELEAYVAAGIQSDHECVRIEEATEKYKRGMHIMIREGSTEKNLEALLPLAKEDSLSRCMFVVDDRTCKDMYSDGDLDAVVRKATMMGLDPIDAIRMATINTATYFKLDKLGAVAPGYYANLIVTDDLKDIKAGVVFFRGRRVASGHKPLFDVPRSRGKKLRDTVRIGEFRAASFELKTKQEKLPVIEVIPGQIITLKKLETVKISRGQVVPDIENDILKAAVLERHRASGNIGVGLVKGFGLKKGAIASSVAHDSHNIVVVGTNDSDMYAAVMEIQRMQGGLTVVCDGMIRASLPLPVAGLLSDKPLEIVVANLAEVEKEVINLGSKLPSAFSVLSFLALPVIPELRLTDLGLVDVNTFSLIET